MAQTLTQTSAEKIVTSGTTGTVGLIGVAAGSLLAMFAGQETDGTNFNLPTDDNTNTWLGPTQLGIGANGVGMLSIAQNAHAGTTNVTLTIGSAKTYRFMLQEWAGSVTTGNPDTTSSITEAGGTTSHVCSADASHINPVGACVVLCSCSNSNTGGTKTPGTGYTRVTNTGSFDFWQYKIFTSAPVNERGVWTSTLGIGSSNVILAFDAAAGGTTYNDSIALASKSSFSATLGGTFQTALNLISGGNVIDSLAETQLLAIQLASKSTFSDLINATVGATIGLAASASLTQRGDPLYPISVAVAVSANVSNVMSEILTSLVSLGASANEQQTFTAILKTAINLQVLAALQVLAGTPGIPTDFIQLVKEAWSSSSIINETWSQSTIINEKGNI